MTTNHSDNESKRKSEWLQRLIPFMLSLVVLLLLPLLFYASMIFYNEVVYPFVPNTELIGLVGIYTIIVILITITLTIYHKLIATPLERYHRAFGFSLGLTAILFPITPVLFVLVGGGQIMLIFGFDSTLWALIALQGIILTLFILSESKIVERLRPNEWMVMGLYIILALILSVSSLFVATGIQAQGYLDVYATPFHFLVHLGGIALLIDSLFRLLKLRGSVWLK